MFDHIPAKSGIYAIVNKQTGERYVGQSENMYARAKYHVGMLDKGAHRTNKKRLLQRAWRDCGRGAFKIVVLEIVKDNYSKKMYQVRSDNLSLAEQFYVNKRSDYNIDKRIVRDEFKPLIVAKVWRNHRANDGSKNGI